MAWTRRQPPPMQIYQDPGTFYDQPEMYQIPDEYHPNPLKPLKNAAAPRKQSAVFDPPPLMPSGKSPCKVSMQTVPPPTAVFSSRFDKVTIPPPPSESFSTDSPKKKPAFSTFSTSVMQRPQKALFTTFPSARSNDKENQHPSQHVYSDNFAEFPDASFGQKAYQPGQRGRPPAKALLEAAPIRDKQPVKKGKGEEAATIHIPEPEEMPAVEDDGMKPPYSYATLIGMSILRASNRRLTLAQIYKWISDNFAYYRIAETGWQNSIRHNLSLNKAFVKQERPKDDPGKGNYWVIELGMEGQFIKDKQVRRPASLSTAPSLPTLPALPPAMKEMPQATTIHGHGHGQDHGHRHTGSKKSITMEKPKAAQPMPALSSDATLPASDPALQDDTSQDERDGFRAIEQKLHRAMKKSRSNSKHHFHIHSSGEDTSSPPQINSSPPIMHGIKGREATPPPPPQFSMSSNHNHSRKRKSEGMDDSGYFSALQSSVHKRPRTAGALATSEADLDRPKSKRGRAEEEIARIRRSSHTSSPTKPRGNILQSLSNSQLLSSSPIRHVVDTSLMLPPLTPATTFKLPRASGTHLMPTISQAREASPNTNLRQHRDEIRKLVGSPERGADLSAAFLAVDAGASSSSRFFDDSYFFDDCSLEVDDFGGDTLGGLGEGFPF